MDVASITPMFLILMTNNMIICVRSMYFCITVLRQHRHIIIVIIYRCNILIEHYALFDYLSQLNVKSLQVITIAFIDVHPILDLILFKM